MDATFEPSRNSKLCNYVLFSNRSFTLRNYICILLGHMDTSNVRATRWKGTELAWDLDPEPPRQGRWTGVYKYCEGSIALQDESAGTRREANC